MGIKTDAKFLPTVAGTGLFKWARKSRILLTKKLSVLFLLLSALWFMASWIAEFPVVAPGKGHVPKKFSNTVKFPAKNQKITSHYVPIYL